MLWRFIRVLLYQKQGMSGYLEDIKRALTPTKLKTDDSKEAQSESPSTVCSTAPTRLEEQNSHQRKNEYLSEIP